MNCVFVMEHLDAYLDDLLPGADGERVAAHLDHCSDCAAALLRRVDVALDDDLADVRARVRAADPGVEPTRRGVVPLGHRGRYVAAAVLVVMVGFALSRSDAMSGEQRVLEALRRGPAGVQSVRYEVSLSSEGARREIRGERVFQWPRLQLAKHWRDGELSEARGFDGSWSWSFDAKDDRVRFLGPDDDHAAAAAGADPGGGRRRRSPASRSWLRIHRRSVGHRSPGGCRVRARGSR